MELFSVHCASQEQDDAIQMDPTEITRLIEAGIDNAKVRILTDDNTHYQAIVIADAFEGLRPLARHQLVYQCLGSLVGNEIHALSIRALTSAEVRTKGGG